MEGPKKARKKKGGKEEIFQPEGFYSKLKQPQNIFLLIVFIVAFSFLGYLIGSRVTNSKVHTERGDTFNPFSSEDSSTHPPELARLLQQLVENPQDATLLSLIGDAYFQIKRFQEAAEYYKRAVDINPENVGTINDLALSKFYMGNIHEGLKYVEEGIKKDPNYQRIWLTKGFFMAYGRENYIEARAAWEKAISLNPNSPVAEAAKDYIAQFKNK